MREHFRWILAGIVALTLLLTLAIVLDVSPYLRGPDEWRWHYAIPSRPVRHLIPLSVVSVYVAITMVWGRRVADGRTRTWGQMAFLLFIVLSVPIIQASLYAVEDPSILEQPFYRTVSPTSSGVFSVGSTINDPLTFLAHYPERMVTFPIHPQRYPPGLPLLFYGIRRILEGFPGVANALASRLRLYQCHNLTLMRLSNATIASSLLQMALPIVCGLTVLPIYGLGRRALGRRAAIWAAALYPLVPSFNLWFAQWDAFYALLVAVIWFLFHVGLTESRPVVLAASGGLLSVASSFSLGNLALLLPMGCWAILWLATHRNLWSWGELVTEALVFGMGLTSLWALYQVTLGTGFFDIWRVSMSYHLGLGRSYWLWLGYHIYDFLLFLGLPLAVLLCSSLATSVRRFRRERKVLLPLGLGLGVLLLNLSGMAQGEVARVWLFLTPFATLAAAYGLVQLLRRSFHIALVVSLLAVQLLTFNAFLRVVNTGLYDPPDRERVFSLPSIGSPQKARLGDRITLLGYDLTSRRVRQGDNIHLTLYWQPTGPVFHPYTVFTHLIDSHGELVAQQDGMPMSGTVPTTCWVPEEVIVDRYDIAVDPNLPPGDYRLETGLYVWETGKRLPSTGRGAIPDGRVLLTTISVGAD